VVRKLLCTAAIVLSPAFAIAETGSCSDGRMTDAFMAQLRTGMLISQVSAIFGCSPAVSNDRDSFGRMITSATYAGTNNTVVVTLSAGYVTRWERYGSSVAPGPVTFDPGTNVLTVPGLDMGNGSKFTNIKIYLAPDGRWVLREVADAYGNPLPVPVRKPE
jgi:hypothetical protein